MHEFSVAAAIVDTAVRHADGRRVTEVWVRCGRLRQVVPASLQFAFGVLTRDTLCEGARLTFEDVPARLRCESCESEWEIEVPAFRCPSCAGSDVVVASGDELEVDSIEVAEEAGCIA